MRKLLSLVLVVVMTLSLTVDAFAVSHLPTPKARDSLSGRDLVIYDSILDIVRDTAEKLARGETPDSPKHTIYFEELGIPTVWTSDMIGKQISMPTGVNNEPTDAEKNAIVNRFPVIDKDYQGKLYSAVAFDYPQYVFWVYGHYFPISHDSSKYTFSKKVATDGSPYIELYRPSMTVQLYTNDHYCKNPALFRQNYPFEYTKPPQDFRSDRTSDIVNALAEAQRIVDSVAEKSDYEKVVAYQQYICKNNVYNKTAANDPIKDNTRNLIYIFDKNPNTNVVCEGYAKAFKYLCDLSDIPCYIVTSDSHMWNIVQMDDEKFYHTDITWCDVDKYNGYWSRYLLKGAPNGITNKHSYVIPYNYDYVGSTGFKPGSSTYTFESQTLGVWGSQLPTLATSDYVPAKITFQNERGAAPAERYVNRGELLNAPEAPTADGYVFDGWARADGSTFNFASDTIGLNESNVVLKAQWSVDPETMVPHTVTFKTERGTTPEPQTVNYGETATQPDMPDVEGYFVSGWDMDNGTKFDFSSKITEDITLTAKWQGHVYAIKYNLNGGSATGNPSAYTYGSSLTLNDPTKNGYAFDGWTVDGKPFDPAVPITSAITLTAEWTPVAYDIEYDLDGGTVEGNPTSYTVEDRITLNNPKKDGYTFTGWQGYGSTAVIERGSTGKKTFKALYSLIPPTPETYSVTVANTANGTAKVSSSTATAGETITVTATPASGYELDNITTTPSATVTNGKFTMPASDVTVTVTFKAVSTTPTPQPTQPAKLTGTVTVSGTPKVGETLTAKVDGTNNSGALSYQWKAGGANVGANKAVYQPTAADIGKTVTCEVTSNVETGSIVSAPTAAVAAAAAPAATKHTVTVANTANGTAKVSSSTAAAGETITVTAMPASGYELDSITTSPSATVTNGKFVMPDSDVTVKVTFKAAATTTTKTEQSITLNRSSLDLEQGDSGTLTATVKPAAGITWSSSNTRIVSVDSNGRYLARDVGSATITATANGKSATCRVYVEEPYVSNRAPNNLPMNSQSTTRPTEQKQPTTAQAPAAPTMRTVNNPDGSKSTIVNYSDGSLSNVKTDNYGQVLAETVTYSDSAAASNGTLTIPAAVRPAKNSNSAPEIRLVLPTDASTKKHTVRIPVESPTSTTVAVIQNSFGEDIVAVSSSVQNGYLEVDLDGSAVVKVVDNARWFYDVSDTNWFANAVAWASSRGVMNGVSEHMFDPNTKTNRAMMSQILYNLSGTNSTAVSSRFSDVSAGDWFGKSVTWATGNGIARSSGNYFGATSDMSREDMVSMLYNYAKWKGYDTSARGNLSGFGDSATVSDWARDAMSWAVGTGLITGTQNGTRAVVLDPHGTATRAQIATVMQRYCGMFA